MTELKELINGRITVDHLEGLQFIHGTQDCYTLLQRVYADNFGILLSDYARPDDWWLNDEFDLYRSNFVNEGFTLVDIDINNLKDLRPFDVLLIAIPDPRKLDRMVPNHCAVYLGEGKIIHHRYGLLSKKELYKGTLRNLTCMVLRHKQVPHIVDTSSVTKVNILDKLLPHKRELIMGALNDTR